MTPSNIARSLIGWGRVVEAEVLPGGGVELEGTSKVALDGDPASDVAPRQSIVDCALPGFYGVHGVGDAVATLRTERGGVTLAASVARPSDAVAAERGLWRQGKDVQLLRLTRQRPGLGVPVDDALDVTGCVYILLGRDGTLKAVVRNNDGVDASTPMAVWMGQVETVLNAIVPGSIAPLHPTTIGNSVASTTRLYGG